MLGFLKETVFLMQCNKNKISTLINGFETVRIHVLGLSPFLDLSDKTLIVNILQELKDSVTDFPPP